MVANVIYMIYRRILLIVYGCVYSVYKDVYNRIVMVYFDGIQTLLHDKTVVHDV